MIRLYYNILLIALLLYAVMGKGFAYLGIPPLYTAEILLFLGLLVVLLNGKSLYSLFHPHKNLLTLPPFFLWGAFCMLPYLRQYGLMALRDAVIWAYAVFAIIIFALLYARPDLLPYTLKKYAIFTLIFPAIVLVLRLAFLAGVRYPNLPGTNVALIQLKGGDIAVHLTGVTIFYLLSFTKIKNPIWGLITLATFVLIASSTRGGALAYAVGVGVVVILRGHLPKRLVHLGILFACLALIIIVVNPSIRDLHNRDIHIRQVVNNYISILSDNRDLGPNLYATKNWRLTWWSTILDYTIFGEHFIAGKGYGINLADDDGFQTKTDNSLRSPHNVSMTFLARSGVIGLALWLWVQATWFLVIFRSYLLSRQKGEMVWQRLFLFLIGYWLAFLINASFDVFLEGPMGGVWFWVLFGFGLACARIFRHNPRILSNPVPVEENPLSLSLSPTDIAN